MVCPSTLAVFVTLVASALPPPKAATARIAPAPRQLYPKFDLTYLPKVDGQGVIGLRPAEIAKYATREEVKRASYLVLGMCSQMFGGKELDADAWPTFDDLEQCVFCLQFHITAPKEDERGQSFLGGRTPGVVRTVRPFDWNALLKKSFTKATAARHAGRSYLKIPLPAEIAPPEGESMAAYIPDDRTMVLGSESEIHTLLDRLAAKKPAPKPLPGWNEVDRDVIAFALDNREEPLISGRFPDDFIGGKEMETLAGSLRTLAVGLSVGDATRVRIVATTRNDSAARTVDGALTSFFSQVGEKVAKGKDLDPLETLGAALLKSATVNRDGRRVTVSLTADGNVLKMILEALLGGV